MTDEEKIQAEVDRRIDQDRKQRSEFEAVAKQLFKPMDAFLEQWQRDNVAGKVTEIRGKVDTISTVQSTQGREIKELKGSVAGLTESMTGVKERVAAIPGERAKDIQAAITVESERFGPQDINDISGLINTAEKKGREDALRIAEAAKSKTGAANGKTGMDNVVPAARSSNRILFLIQTYLPYILIGLAVIGAWVAAINGDPSEELEQGVEKAADNSEDAQRTIEELRKMIESVAENPPASFDTDMNGPTTTQP